MVNVFIIHGTEGSPEGNWFPWLKTELEKLGCKVFVPKFPTPENQSLSTWLKTFEEYKHFVDENTIFVGHRLGPAFILSVIESLKKPVKAAFLVAGFLGLIGNEYYDSLIKSFTTRKFDWSKIRKNCRSFYTISSDNDPYVSLEKGRELAKNIGAEIIMVKNGGHLNKESGYTKFTLLLEKIKEELKTN